MSLSEPDKKSKEKKSQEKPWQMIPFVLEKLSATVESFTEKALTLVSESADDLINRGVQRLFGLLCLLAGMIFFLFGGAQILDYMIGLPGIGAMIVGMAVLLMTALFLLAQRTKT